MNDSRVATCVLCGGPIGNGEPVVRCGDGFAHRFKNTCEYERELAAERDRNILHALGVDSCK